MKHKFWESTFLAMPSVFYSCKWEGGFLGQLADKIHFNNKTEYTHNFYFVFAAVCLLFIKVLIYPED
jgi:hypothetical protein